MKCSSVHRCPVSIWTAGRCLFERCHASPACPSDKILLRRRSVRNIGGMILTAETEVLGEKLAESNFVHHKSHMD